MARGKLDLSKHKLAKHTPKSKKRAYKPVKGGKVYGEVWRLVDGAIRDALTSHPQYVQPKFLVCCRMSITKRVTGAVMGYVAQAAKGHDTNESAQAPVGVEAERRVVVLKPSLIDRHSQAIKAWVAKAHARFFGGK